MLYSATVLAQGRGHVVITPEWDRGSYPWRRTDQLVVRRLDASNVLLEETTILAVPQESVRDMKARAIAAVRMLGYWPQLRRSIAADRKTSLGDWGQLNDDRAADELFKRASRSGIILPGAP